jgi:hypothetical protein
MPLHQDPEVGADVLTEGPVDRDVGPHCGHQLARDGAEGLVAEDLHSAVVRLQRVVEG